MADPSSARGLTARQCQTPGAVFSTKITDCSVAVQVDLPYSLRLTEADAEMLEASLHNAVELALARYFPCPDGEERGHG